MSLHFLLFRNSNHLCWAPNATMNKTEKFETVYCYWSVSLVCCQIESWTKTAIVRIMDKRFSLNCAWQNTIQQPEATVLLQPLYVVKQHDLPIVDSNRPIHKIAPNSEQCSVFIRFMYIFDAQSSLLFCALVCIFCSYTVSCRNLRALRNWRMNALS